MTHKSTWCDCPGVALGLGGFTTHCFGYYDGPLWRFDLMPVYWQIASVTLSAFFPFAAIGLWMLASWGPVIWFICAVTETVMYVVFPATFGQHYLVVAIHIFAACLYAAFRIIILVQKRRLTRQG